MVPLASRARRTLPRVTRVTVSLAVAASTLLVVTSPGVADVGSPVTGPVPARAPLATPSPTVPPDTPAPVPVPPVPPLPIYTVHDLTQAAHRPDCAPVAAAENLVLLTCGDTETVLWDGHAATRVDAEIDQHPLYSQFVPLTVNARGDVGGRLVKRLPTGPEHAVAAVRLHDGTWRTYSVPAPTSDPEPHGDACADTRTDTTLDDASEPTRTPTQRARRELRRGFTGLVCRLSKPLFSYATSAIHLDHDGTALVQTVASRPYVFRQAYMAERDELRRIADPLGGNDVLGFTIAPGKVVYGRAQVGIRGLGFAHVWPTLHTYARLRGLGDYGASEVTAVSPDGTLVAGYVRQGSGQGRPAWLSVHADPQILSDEVGMRVASVVSANKVVSTSGVTLIDGVSTDLRPFVQAQGECDLLDGVHMYPNGDVLVGARFGSSWSTLLLRAAPAPADGGTSTPPSSDAKPPAGPASAPPSPDAPAPTGPVSTPPSAPAAAASTRGLAASTRGLAASTRA